MRLIYGGFSIGTDKTIEDVKNEIMNQNNANARQFPSAALPVIQVANIQLSQGKELHNDDVLSEKLTISEYNFAKLSIKIKTRRRRLGNQRLINRFIRESIRCRQSQ